MSGGFLPQKSFSVSPGIGLSVVRPKKKLKALHWDKVDTPETSHWAAHAPTAEEREEKYNELNRKGILDEVEKLFMAKEIKQIGAGGVKKSDKKQIISSDLRKAYGRSPTGHHVKRGWLTMSQKLPWPSFRSTLLKKLCK